MKGKLVSLVPNLMKAKEWTPTMLDDTLRDAGVKISWPLVHGLSKGEIIPGTRGPISMLLKLCIVFECQPNDLILFVPEVE